MRFVTLFLEVISGVIKDVTTLAHLSCYLTVMRVCYF